MITICQGEGGEGAGTGAGVEPVKQGGEPSRLRPVKWNMSRARLGGTGKRPALTFMYGQLFFPSSQLH